MALFDVPLIFRSPAQVQADAARQVAVRDQIGARSVARGFQQAVQKPILEAQLKGEQLRNQVSQLKIQQLNNAVDDRAAIADYISALQQDKNAVPPVGRMKTQEGTDRILTIWENQAKATLTGMAKESRTKAMEALKQVPEEKWGDGLNLLASTGGVPNSGYWDWIGENRIQEEEKLSPAAQRAKDTADKMNQARVARGEEPMTEPERLDVEVDMLQAEAGVRPRQEPGRSGLRKLFDSMIENNIFKSPEERKSMKGEDGKLLFERVLAVQPRLETKLAKKKAEAAGLSTAREAILKKEIDRVYARVQGLMDNDDPLVMDEDGVAKDQDKVRGVFDDAKTEILQLERELKGEGAAPVATGEGEFLFEGGTEDDFLKDFDTMFPPKK